MSQPQGTDRKVGGDQHDLAVGRGRARRRAAQRPAQVSASRSATAPRRDRVAGGRLGHGDDVVARAAAGSCTASAARPCTTRRGGHHDDLLPVAARGGRGPLGHGGERGVAGQEHDVRAPVPASAATTSAVDAVARAAGGRVDAPPLRPSRASLPTSGADDDHEHGPLADEPAGRAVWSANRTTVIRCGRPPAIPASTAAPMSLQCTWTCQSVVGRRRRPPPCRPARPAARAGRRRAVRGPVEQVHHLVVVPPSEPVSRSRAISVDAAPGRPARGGGAGGRPVTSATSASRSEVRRPCPPASTTPARPSSGSWSGVARSAAARGGDRRRRDPVQRTERVGRRPGSVGGRGEHGEDRALRGRR